MSRILLSCLIALVCVTWSSAADINPPVKPEALATADAAIVTDPTKVTVSVTPSGAKYHTKDCKAAKNGKDESLAQALADGLQPCSLCHPPVYDPTTIAVYTGGDGGKKYHAKGCRFAKGETTLAEAKTDGLEPCKVCNPPPLPGDPAKPTKSPDDAPKK